MIVATVTAVFFINCYNHSRMQTSILLKAQGKPATSPVIILTGPAIGAKCSTSLTATACLNALAKGAAGLAKAVFSGTASLIALGVVVSLMWWHLCSIVDSTQSQHAVATDALYVMPWGLVWAVRSVVSTWPKKGGRA